MQRNIDRPSFNNIDISFIRNVGGKKATTITKMTYKIAFSELHDTDTNVIYRRCNMSVDLSIRWLIVSTGGMRHGREFQLSNLK